MKKMTLTALSLLAVFASSSALAADAKTPPATPEGPPPGHHMFDDTDANKDGTISKEEWVAKGDKIFGEIDTNHDGKITPEEMKAHHEAKRAEWKEHREEHKAGGDNAPGVKPAGSPEKK